MTTLFLVCVDSNVAVNLRHKKLSKIVASRSKMFTTELRCIHFRTEITYVILNCSYGVCVCERLICTLEETLLVQERIPRKEILWGLQPPFHVTWLKQDKCYKEETEFQ